MIDDPRHSDKFCTNVWKISVQWLGGSQTGSADIFGTAKRVWNIQIYRQLIFQTNLEGAQNCFVNQQLFNLKYL